MGYRISGVAGGQVACDVVVDVGRKSGRIDGDDAGSSTTVDCENDESDYYGRDPTTREWVIAV